jgi:uncharacterized protein YxeA
MKKILAIVATLVLTMTACADRRQLVQYSELPAQAQSFIQKYFNKTDVSYIERDLDGMVYEYNVYLQNGTEIEFNHQGAFQSIDCQRSAVPEGIVPELIASFVALHHPNQMIVEYKVEYRRLKVGLSNDWELEFDLDGNFLGIDD